MLQYSESRIAVQEQALNMCDTIQDLRWLLKNEALAYGRVFRIEDSCSGTNPQLMLHQPGTKMAAQEQALNICVPIQELRWLLRNKSQLMLHHPGTKMAAQEQILHLCYTIQELRWLLKNKLSTYASPSRN